MGEPGAGEVQMRGVGMADRRHHPPLRIGGLEVDDVAEPALLHDLGERLPARAASSASA